VLDPFMGLGHTAIACARLGISCVGFEIDPDYFDASCRQVGQAVGCGSEEVTRRKEFYR